ncbi:amino acid adenylation domain-containing protein [Chromobacterium vaccinii]|uniref:amino acid adenylation domain-containing protein n=1 Tax=Chromobacterium vaccinii TaxID=1108595 RepID=UPI003C76F7A1
MNPISLLAEMEALDIRLWVEQGQLRFRAPDGALTEERKALLREHKAALIAHLSEEAEAPRADPANRHQPFPLTDIQAAYLVGRSDAYAYGGTGCHGYVELDFDQHLDPERLQAAWRRLIARHDMLRAVVSTAGWQQVLEQVPPPSLPVLELRAEPEAIQKQALAALREDMSHRVYPPDRWPLHALRLSQTGSGSRLHLSLDLLIADFVSIRLMLAELDLLYRHPDREPPLPTIGFRELVLARQAEHECPAAQARLQRDRQYWLERLDTLPEAPALPLRDDAAASGAARFRRLALSLEPEAWRDFCRHAGARRITPSSAVLAAFADVVARWSSQPAFSLGITLLKRPPLHPDVDKVIGDFTSVNLLEVQPAAGEAFAAAAERLQRRLWTDLEHDGFSGVAVLREMARQRQRRDLIMPVVFTSTLGLGGGDGFMQDGRLSYGISQTPQVWLDCQAAERDGALQLNWDVREGVFPDGMAEAAFAALEAALRALAASEAGWDDALPAALPNDMLAARERANATSMPLPEQTLHQGFLDMALARPQATAVIAGGQACSYGELAAHARAIAQALTASGLEPGEPVAIAVDKSVTQIAAVIGALMAGAAYLPLDLQQPPARRDAILADAGVRRVLVDAAWRSAGYPDGLIVISTEPRNLPAPGTESTGRTMPAKALAYVIYTSGSTGQPKGVMISHQAAVNTLRDIGRRFGVNAADRVLGLASLSFDLSVFDVFGTLAAGGALVLPDPERRGDPGHWAQLLTDAGVTIWNSVPAQLQMLQSYLDSAPGLAPPSLRLAMLSGDWIPVPLPAAMRRHCPSLRMISLGGATEAAIWSIWHEIERLPAGARSVPYGKPLANQRFHVLDRGLSPRPDWVAGELYIAGDGLALGYLNDEARSRERFISHPASGERLYRTGDLGRYLPDGTIEFLGRDDAQVKIRGHRVELGEIEAALQAHPQVAMASAVVCGDSPLERRIAAFVEPVACPQPDTAALRRQVAASVAGAGAASIAGVDLAAFQRWVAAADAVAHLDMLTLLRSRGLFADLTVRHAPERIVVATSAAPQHHRLLRRWLRSLQRAGWLDGNDEGYALARLPAVDEPEQAWRELLRLEDRVGYSRELLRYLRDSAAHLSGLLSGEVDPLRLLFPEGRLETAVAAYNDNLVNRCMNAAVCAAAAEIAAGRAASDPAKPFRVLEVGAGVGGTSRALIPALDGINVDYLYTDVSPFFLNEARARHAGQPWVRYGLFDLNQPYAEQGLQAGSWDMIVCSNVLHNAKHAPTVLANLRELGAPGCALVVIEATREIAALMTSMEFQVGLSGFVDEREELDQTFFDRGQWLRLFDGAGAETLCCYPAADEAIASVGQTVFVVRFPETRAALHEQDLRRHLRQRLPEAMQPAWLEWLPSLPLTRNGKLDRAALKARGGFAPADGDARREQPLDELEARIATLWGEALGGHAPGREQDFFQAGGDSLLIAQVVARMRERLPEAAGWEWDRLMREVLLSPTVMAIAEKLRRPRDDGPDLDGGAPDPLVELAPAGGDDGLAHVLLHDGSGTLAPYRALQPLLMDSPRRTGSLLAFTVPDAHIYLDRDAGTLIAGLAAEYAERLLARPEKRFHLIGYCMGGLLALELSRVLLEAGVALLPTTVISSDHFGIRVDDDLLLERAFGGLLGADLAAAGHPPADATMARAVRTAMARHGGDLPDGCLLELGGDLSDVADAYRKLAGAPPAERMARLAATAPGKIEAGIRDQLDMLFRNFRHSLEAVRAYRPEPFLGDLQLLCDSQSLHFLPGLEADMRGFWRGIAIGGLRIDDIDGDHISCLQAPRAAAVAGLILAEDDR